MAPSATAQFAFFIMKTKNARMVKCMIYDNSGKEHEHALEMIAHSISHRLRKPIVTMLGLLSLIKLRLLNEDEFEMVIRQLYTSLDELDQASREVGAQVYREQQRLNEAKPPR